MLLAPTHFPIQKPTDYAAHERRTVVVESLHAQTAVLAVVRIGRHMHVTHRYGEID